jgi:hypothetical protein
MYSSHVREALEEFKCVANRHNIRTIFKTKHILRSSFMKTKPQRDQQQTAQCVCSIPCEFDRAAKGQQAVLSDYRHELIEGLLGKSKLAHHAYEEGDRIG